MTNSLCRVWGRELAGSSHKTEAQAGGKARLYDREGNLVEEVEQKRRVASG